jgi:hypothetical protein
MLDGTEDEEFKKVTCPNCQERFTPKVLERVKPPTPEEKAAAEAKAKQEAIVARIENTRLTALIFTVLAVVSLVIGFFLLINAFLAAGDRYATPTGPAADVFFGAAAWFYLIAQLLHIRANTAEIAAQRK